MAGLCTEIPALQRLGNSDRSVQGQFGLHNMSLSRGKSEENNRRQGVIDRSVHDI